MCRLTLRLFIVASIAIFLLLPLTSAATSETINYTEDFVEVESNLRAPTDKGTHSSFAEMQDKDGIFDTLTEENVGGAGGTEWLSVNAFDSTWDTFDILEGDSPWLGAQDQPTHMRGELASADAQLGWFDFPATTLTGTLAVNISCYTDSLDGDDWLDVWVDYTGAGAGADVGDIGLHIGWQYDTIDLGSHTVAEVNLLRVHFIYKKGGGGDDVWIDHCRIGVSAAGGADYELDLEVGWTVDTDYDETVEYLCIFGGTQDAEALKVDIWDGTWVNIIADVAAGWNNVSISSYLTGVAVEIRFIDSDQSEAVESAWEIEGVLIKTYSTAYTEVRYEEITIDETDYTSRGVTKNLFESMTIDETDIEQVVMGKLLFESITMDETITIILDAAAVLYESITADETISTAAAIISILFESVALAATGYFNKIIQKFLFEGVTVSVTLGSVLTASRTLFESVTISDTRSTSAAISRTLFEAITLDETVYPESGIAEELYLFESITINETAYPQLVIQKLLFESVAINETDTRILTAVLTLSEQISISFDLNTSANITRILFESITIDETVTATPSAGLTELYLFETVTFDETDLIGVIRGAFLYESITVNESIAASLDASISLFESVTINETITNTFSGEWILNLSESFNYGENDVWGPYRPEPVNPGGGGIVSDIPPGGGSAIAAVYNLAPLAIVALIVGGAFYISKIQPKRMEGSRELVIKGMSTIRRTARRTFKRGTKKKRRQKRKQVRK